MTRSWRAVRRARRGTAAALAVATTAFAATLPASVAHATPTPGGLGAIDHIVVIYEENHSFDNLFGGWEGVDGLPGKPVKQVDTAGAPLKCLPMDDINLVDVGAVEPTDCPISFQTNPADPATKVTPTKAFPNEPFGIEKYIKPGDKTCPEPGFGNPFGMKKGAEHTEPGGCTRDLVHRFYEEQYQIDGGRQDRYVVGSDAVGLSVGHYDTKQLPIYKYLHGPGAPHYAVSDNLFQGAFGGSFLNHQWLIAASTPTWPGAPASAYSVVPADGNPVRGAPLHPQAAGVNSGALTQAANPDGTCKADPKVGAPPAGTLCGDYAVNTVQPAVQPYFPDADPTKPAPKLPAQTAPTIGDRLSAKGVDWAWYAGGWDNAAGNTTGTGWTNGSDGKSCQGKHVIAHAAYPYCADANFQFHHQPFNYYANYAPGKQARTDHLRDETEFTAAARDGKLRPVSFVKPVGDENEHPGYASETNGSNHLVDLIKLVQGGPQAASTAIVVTYDEFGGAWDHVSPPKGDKFGPGTRVPALVISPKLPKPSTVDHVQHDTTSILATIEHRFDVAALGSRDAAVADFSALFIGATGGTETAEPGLPATGRNLLTIALVGVGLVVVGAGAVIVARRRKT